LAKDRRDGNTILYNKSCVLSIVLSDTHACARARAHTHTHIGYLVHIVVIFYLRLENGEVVDVLASCF